MKKVAEQHIFTKCCKCNTFEVISDLVHDFMNFNALNNFSSSIDKVSFKKNSMSLGLVVLEKKLFTRTRTPTPQSDDIMSAD